MKTSNILTTTSLLALLSGFGAIACGGAEVEPADQSQSAGLTQPAGKTPAPEAMRPDARGEHQRRRGEHGFGPPSPEKLIERFDTNKNGQLEAAELPPRMQENIGAIDTSGDGVVSKDELLARFAARSAEHAAKFAERAKQRFEKKDTNHDGVLEQAEVGERWAKLSVADANGDQKLTPEELKAAFESGKLKPMRGEHGRRWNHGEHQAPPADAPAAPATPAPAL
jgi:Ca2+-binding EF-hand superfamily protein